MGIEVRKEEEMKDLIGELLWIVIFLGIVAGVFLAEKYKGRK